ncbi:DUF58 domain-containing protein [Paenibacillus eucommiae]|uniref:Uncharacterized protein (DUF58 family) n=1 Tax=Paenibacillus eucommiae TaxID=1355755 RepID=A0ABS4IT04_9BACL|nr:DUF58 domain-containing protein [Paenibacillus eucommiae]MBP1990265.1 uncharacterized protein (DUF58 family) [Paenibacillus eucommiae]
MGISWILLLAAAVAYLQNLFFRRWGFSRLTVTRKFSEQHCFSGDEVEMIETIVNRKLLPIPWLRLESMIHAGLRFGKQSNLDINDGKLYQNHRSLFSLMPYTKIVRRHQVLCEKRGWYKLDSVAVSVGDALGMQVGTQSHKLNLRLLVYPKLIDWQELPLPSHSWQGDITVKRWVMQDPFLSAGVREYGFGDPLSSIHWKATARSQKLQVYNREFTADPRLMIILNTQISEMMWEAVSDTELVEKGISYAATLAERVIAAGIPVGFGCNAYTEEVPKEPIYISPEGGWDHLNSLYETMAKLVVACCRSFDTYLDADAWQDGTALDFILITPFLSDKVEEQIQRLRDRGHAVEVVMLTHEMFGEGVVQ